MVSPNFAATSILEQALEIFHSSEHGKPQVTEILILTDQEHYNKKDQIKIIFTLESTNTPASNSRLVFQKPEPHLACRYCKKIFPYPEKSNSIYGPNLTCPRCGSDSTQMLTFDGVMVKKIKIG
ncbi:MAG: hydrogenase maturation nickel metallochaperone HypA [Candidatus Hodarchaeales archaeon]|jgi:Zn finger protein HypA/HybF involved in hydrogenase expression